VPLQGTEDTEVTDLACLFSVNSVVSVAKNMIINAAECLYETLIYKIQYIFQKVIITTQDTEVTDLACLFSVNSVVSVAKNMIINAAECLYETLYIKSNTFLIK
jgi:uncharacterized protein YrrD